jgi:hypothetical protein
MTTQPILIPNAPISEERPRTVLAIIIAAILFSLAIIVWSVAATPPIETTSAHELDAVKQQQSIEISPVPTNPAP